MKSNGYSIQNEPDETAKFDCIHSRGARVEPLSRARQVPPSHGVIGSGRMSVQSSLVRAAFESR